MHDDHFPQDAEDETWLADVGARDWLVITKDKNIRRRPLERRALERAKVGAFFVSGGNMTGTQMAALLEKQLMAMIRFAARTTRPFLAAVSDSGVRALK